MKIKFHYYLTLLLAHFFPKIFDRYYDEYINIRFIQIKRRII